MHSRKQHRNDSLGAHLGTHTNFITGSNAIGATAFRKDSTAGSYLYPHRA